MRVDDHLSTQRYDLRPGSALCQLDDPLRGRIGVEQIEATAENFQRGQRAAAAAGSYAANMGCSCCAKESGISSSGKRQGPTRNPIWPIAHFIAIGLVVWKSTSMSGNSDACKRAASATLPPVYASTIARYSREQRCDATPTTPSAPSAKHGKKRWSSPDHTINPSLRSARIMPICLRSPLDSLTPAMLPWRCARSSNVEGNILAPVRPGML